MPPAPGCQLGPEPCPRSPGSSCQVCPPSRSGRGRRLRRRRRRVRIGQRRLEMPDPLELPGMRRAVVPLVGAGLAVVDELVAHRLPGLAAVVGALDHLPEPAAGLRGIQPVRVGRRALHVVDLPAPEVGTADVPLLAFAVGGQDEGALPCTDQDPYLAHCYSSSTLPGPPRS